MRNNMKDWLMFIFIILLDLALIASIIGMFIVKVNPLMILLMMILTGSIMVPFNYCAYSFIKDVWKKR